MTFIEYQVMYKLYHGIMFSSWQNIFKRNKKELYLRYSLGRYIDLTYILYVFKRGTCLMGFSRCEWIESECFSNLVVIVIEEFGKFPAVCRKWEKNSNANCRAWQILYGLYGMGTEFCNLGIGTSGWGHRGLLHLANLNYWHGNSNGKRV